MMSFDDFFRDASDEVLGALGRASRRALRQSAAEAARHNPEIGQLMQAMGFTAAVEPQRIGEAKKHKNRKRRKKHSKIRKKPSAPDVGNKNEIITMTKGPDGVWRE